MIKECKICGVSDPETLNYRDLLISQHSKFFFTPQNVEIIKNEFFKTYTEWMFRPHNINGFKKFNKACFTNGTRESFEYFYLKYLPTKRLRIARGEYFFHQMVMMVMVVSIFFIQIGKMIHGNYGVSQLI